MASSRQIVWVPNPSSLSNATIEQKSLTAYLVFQLFAILPAQINMDLYCHGDGVKKVAGDGPWLDPR